MNPRPWHPGDMLLSLDVEPQYGHPPTERPAVPPPWLADASRLNEAFRSEPDAVEVRA